MYRYAFNAALVLLLVLVPVAADAEVGGEIPVSAPGRDAKMPYPVRVMGTRQYSRLPDDGRCRWLESGPDVWEANQTATEGGHSDSDTDWDTDSNSNSNSNSEPTTATLDAMFRRIVRTFQQDETKRDKLTIVSCPDALPPKTKSDYSKPRDRDFDDEDGGFDEDEDEKDDDDDDYVFDDDEFDDDWDPYDLHAGDGGPWVLVIDEFLSEEETQRLTELGKGEGFRRSTIIDAEKRTREDKEEEDGSNELKEDANPLESTKDSDAAASKQTFRMPKSGRTSSTAWCQSNACRDDDVHQRVVDRIYQLVDIDPSHAEDLQLLHYDPGEYYADHHDYYHIHDPDKWNQDGGRVLTVFLYLNDVEGGGETSFPRLNTTVIPRRGRVVIWPSVLDSDPRSIDWRTEHAALPVTSGVKHGANLWFHLKPFKRQWFNYECDAPPPEAVGKIYGNAIWFDEDDDDDDYVLDDGDEDEEEEDDDDDDDDNLYHETEDEILAKDEESFDNDGTIADAYNNDVTSEL